MKESIFIASMVKKFTLIFILLSVIPTEALSSKTTFSSIDEYLFTVRQTVKNITLDKAANICVKAVTRGNYTCLKDLHARMSDAEWGAEVNNDTGQNWMSEFITCLSRLGAWEHTKKSSIESEIQNRNHGHLKLDFPPKSMKNGKTHAKKFKIDRHIVPRHHVHLYLDLPKKSKLKKNGNAKVRANLQRASGNYHIELLKQVKLLKKKGVRKIMVDWQSLRKLKGAVGTREASDLCAVYSTNAEFSSIKDIHKHMSPARWVKIDPKTDWNWMCEFIGCILQLLKFNETVPKKRSLIDGSET